MLTEPEFLNNGKELELFNNGKRDTAFLRFGGKRFPVKAGNEISSSELVAFVFHSWSLRLACFVALLQATMVGN